MLNYVIATWSGPRRYDMKEAIADRGYYLRHHIAALERYRFTKVNNIIVALIENVDEPPEFAVAVRQLPKRIRGANIIPFYRANVGLSYGSWSDAYIRWQDTADDWMFIEDDYQFCMDDWDTAMLDMMRPRTGYLCGLVRPGQLPHHAGNANGVIRGKVLREIVAKYGKLPHYLEGADYGAAEGHGQVALSQVVLTEGWELQSVTEQYTSHFKHGYCLDPDQGHGPLIMQPIGPYPGRPEENEDGSDTTAKSSYVLNGDRNASTTGPP